MSADSQILVVEDEATIRLIWERFLNRWGYQVDMAENGQVGLDRAREHAYRLIITDLAMPVLGGQELVRTLKAEQPDLEIIVTTGQGTIEIAVEMMKAGVSDFITKPINFGSAEYVIKKCLENVPAKRENIRLRRINRDLEELNKIKEKFIAITNHELRTPVSIINNVLEVLEPEFRGGSLEELFDMISRSSRHLNEIVTQLHEISRLTLAKTPLPLERFNLLALCREVQKEVAFVLQKRGHRTGLKIPEDLSMVADRLKFKKVIRELLQNAIKFTENGGEIFLSATVNSENDLVFEVSDTGIGIQKKDQGKIFDLFFEVGDSLHHHTSKEDFLGGGLGVGLSIVSEIVQAHQGTVSVSSEPKRGSRFTVTLPQHSASREGVSQESGGAVFNDG
ncbi:MAG: hybrid sensor histidine kinase/response regulator [Gemmatimonadetes bacterium]|nr:hybrid sensor histidine kinase/response regulator [Gemmatimonadota bacterium]